MEVLYRCLHSIVAILDFFIVRNVWSDSCKRDTKYKKLETGRGNVTRTSCLPAILSAAVYEGLFKYCA